MQLDVPGEYSQNWFLPNAEKWMEVLGRFRGKLNIHALELGSYEGQSSVFLLKHILTNPTSTLDVVDTWAGGEDQKHLFPQMGNGQLFERFQKNIEPYKNRVRIHQGLTHDVLREMADKVSYFSLSYIDASHLAEDVYWDSKLSWPLLKSNGILIWDDYTWLWSYVPYSKRNPATDNPAVGINKFLSEIEGEYETIYKHHQLIVKKL